MVFFCFIVYILYHFFIFKNAEEEHAITIYGNCVFFLSEFFSFSIVIGCPLNKKGA